MKWDKWDSGRDTLAREAPRHSDIICRGPFAPHDMMVSHRICAVHRTMVGGRVSLKGLARGTLGRGREK